MRPTELCISIACLGIGCINVAFNVLLRRAATAEGSFLTNLQQPIFLAAFALGIASMFSIYWLYSSQIELGRALLLMGAASIVGGSAFAAAAYGTRYTLTETALLVLIAGFYLLRWIRG